jgi:hypothetical protein
MSTVALVIALPVHAERIVETQCRNKGSVVRALTSVCPQSTAALPHGAAVVRGPKSPVELSVGSHSQRKYLTT